ncbi:uncharacterized protein LOC132193824 isoform X2 [Neocloeon triangulifer]|uniref:uncharacterized protein LOC132193824 isoform X2 n=1 Tax=Neocloeon triangulifer TaxID=2078957 RepID=UPI00286EF318|nr:uncharacterized protein LOC132193824 isoform X2 [Neocloeon triangulifer]
MNQVEKIDICRKIYHEPHKHEPPLSLLNKVCPFFCFKENHEPGKIVLRFHSLGWAHIRCNNLKCIYRPFFVKNPMNLIKIFDSYSGNDELQKKAVAEFKKWMEKEKALVNEKDFAEAMAADDLNQRALLYEESDDAGVAGQPLDAKTMEMVEEQEIRLAEELLRRCFEPEQESSFDSEGTPRKRRRRRTKLEMMLERQSQGGATMQPSKFSNYSDLAKRPRGRPKGFSPKKARAEERALTEEPVKLVYFGSKSNAKVNFYSAKPAKQRKFSWKTAALSLFGTSQDPAHKKAKVLVIKALLLLLGKQRPTLKKKAKIPQITHTSIRARKAIMPAKEKRGVKNGTSKSTKKSSKASKPINEKGAKKNIPLKDLKSELGQSKPQTCPEPLPSALKRKAPQKMDLQEAPAKSDPPTPPARVLRPRKSMMV